ncbi:EAL domain-containing protein [Acidovorax sp. Leaf78]|uniref:bifunctional diguanylate cyclase/phosphodiesterase n=1 Tax=Acidovorax sp. Leaf78 TaxID=1736237 RepID=UPI0006F66334|nr:EAL domain-containing protein [Acidovorax sp. Leaf78]KQO19683.1 diguanylate cyclase [Acidovorax sp. Leaf78]
MRAFQLSLRTAIAVPFAVLFAATVALQAVTQHRQITDLIDQESVRLLDAITNTSRGRLAEFLEAPFLIQRSIGDAIARHGLYQPGNLKPLYQHLQGIFSELYTDHQQISLLSFGSQTGEYAGIRRDASARSGFKLILKDNSTRGLMNVYEDASPAKVAAAFPHYDPRVRPWYAPVAQSGTAQWSPIYTTAGERGDVTISAASPVVVKGQLVGVMEADVRLDTLNRFLREEPLRGQGQIFITDAQGRIVAHSEPGALVSDQQDAAGQRERLTVAQSASPQIRAAGPYLQQAATAEGTGFRFTHVGEQYFGRVTRYADPRGIDWRIVVLLPESDLLGDSRSANRQALLATAAIAVLGLILGLWVIERAARPILMTAEAANRIARGEWSTGIEKSSPLLETTILVHAFNQMADRLQRSFNQMRELLIYDSLTQLLTRRGLLEQANWTEPQPAVLTLVGLDAFRAINDNVGYGTGDRLLQAVSERLRARLPAPVLMARLGGDEFALLHLSSGDAASQAQIAKTVLTLFTTPFSAGADEVMVHASVGVVGGHLRGDDLPEWLRNASIALGEAKRRGLNQCVVFEPSMAEQSKERARLATELRQALEKNQFLVHYQPVIELDTGRVSGAEALLRWHSPTRGMVPPGVFIPVAEESDLILALGDWVLRRATQDIAQQLPHLPEGFDLHVNVSARQLIQSDFPAALQQVLATSGLPPRHLTLELTESVLIEGDAVTGQRLARIRALGVKIAIDDFGTGYSSLAYLSRLPFDCVKIDQSFVRNLLDSPQNAAIVTAVLNMSQGFGVTVVAEGVETQAAAQRLREMGCASAQGYWFGRPALLQDMDLSVRLLDGDGTGSLPTPSSTPSTQA